MLTDKQALLLEALIDERTAEVAQKTVGADAQAELTALGLLGPGTSEQAEAALETVRLERAIEWATASPKQGEILAAFARHCLDELDDLEVIGARPTALSLRWRNEDSRIELRAGFLLCEQLVGDVPLLLLGDLESGGGELIEAFIRNDELRARVAIYDLDRLEKVGAVRSSAFVYFEWFLRDEYGVKLLPSAAFTQGLIDRGVISLGFG